MLADSGVLVCGGSACACLRLYCTQVVFACVYAGCACAFACCVRGNALERFVAASSVAYEVGYTCTADWYSYGLEYKQLFFR